MPAFVLFEAASRRFAIAASRVAQVLRAAAPAPIAGGPPAMRGVLDVRGALLPVVDVRVALGIEPRPIRASDQVIVLHADGGAVALLVDRVLDVRDVDDEDVGDARTWTAGADLAEGALKLPDGAVVIQSADGWARLARCGAEVPPA